jgi:hypothetical protein
MDIVVWLRSLGLGKYEAAFRENEIDETVLVDPTEVRLRELSIPLGDRLKLLKAIAALGSPARPTERPASALTPVRASHRGQYCEAAGTAETAAALEEIPTCDSLPNSHNSASREDGCGWLE